MDLCVPAGQAKSESRFFIIRIAQEKSRTAIGMIEPVRARASAGVCDSESREHSAERNSNAG